MDKLLIPYTKNEASGSVQWIWDVYQKSMLSRQAHPNWGDREGKKVTAVCQ